MNDSFDNAHDDKAILAKLTKEDRADLAEARGALADQGDEAIPWVAPCAACAAPEGDHAAAVSMAWVQFCTTEGGRSFDPHEIFLAGYHAATTHSPSCPLEAVVRAAKAVLYGVGYCLDREGAYACCVTPDEHEALRVALARVEQRDALARLEESRRDR